MVYKKLSLYLFDYFTFLYHYLKGNEVLPVVMETVVESGGSLNLFVKCDDWSIQFDTLSLYVEGRYV